MQRQAPTHRPTPPARRFRARGPDGGKGGGGEGARGEGGRRGGRGREGREEGRSDRGAPGRGPPSGHFPPRHLRKSPPQAPIPWCQIPSRPRTGPIPRPRGRFEIRAVLNSGVHDSGFMTSGGLASLVATARGQTPDPIPNSAVKTLSADGTAAQAAEEQVAARLAKPPQPATPPANPGRPSRPTMPRPHQIRPYRSGGPSPTIAAGWSSPVARQAHNLKVVGSNPTPATNFVTCTGTPLSSSGVFVFVAMARMPARRP